MRTIRKLKMREKWIVMMLLAIMGFSAIPMTAANRTIKAVAATGCKVRIYNGSSWGSWSTGTATATVADGKTAKVECSITDNGHSWVKWTGTYTSTNNPYSWTVNKAATLNANLVDTWTEDLISGATYTVTTVSGNYFKVTCSNTSAPSHNKNFTYVGNLTAGGGNVTVNFNNTATVWVNGEIKVTGGTLNLRNANNNIVTLKRNGRNGNLLTSEGGKLSIKGNSSKGARFIIDGGAIFPSNDARNVYVEEVGDFTNHSGVGRLIYCGNDGGLELDNVTLQNAYTFDIGGGICARNTNDTYPVFNVQNTTIQACWAPHGSALMIWGSDQHGTQADGAIFKNVLIQYCYAKGNHNGTDSQGGTIRTNGGGRTRLTLDNCEIRYNLSGNPKTGGYGGGVYWNAGGKPETRITLKNNTRIHHNEAITVCSFVDPNTGETIQGRSWGGGIMIESRMTIESAQVYGNQAKLGGGLYLCTYEGGAETYDGTGFDLTVIDGMKVYGNIATEVGGGAYLDIRRSNDIGFAPDGTPISPHYKFDMQGGEVCGNMAPKGGGVAIMDKAPKKHKNSITGDWSLEYIRNVYIRGGVISNNICTTTASGTQGGGIYIRKYVDPTVGTGDGQTGYTYAEAGGSGTMTVEATAGLVCCNESKNNNKNGVGAGMFINNEVSEAPYNGVCTMNVGGSVQFYANTSDSNGAGVYIAHGDITINGGVIGCDKFSYSYTNNDGNTVNVTDMDGGNICYNGNGAGIAVATGNVTINSGNVDYNYAKNDATYGGGNGGAFYLTGGIATINGGSVSHNTADKNGGGFYVNVSNNTDVTTIKGGAIVSYNTAVNGAGAYINKGQLVIQDATTDINNNTAATSGGGIYMNSGSVEITNALVNHNTATTTHGGGLYVNSGAVTATNMTCNNNTASKRGGGFYVAGGGNNVITGGSIYSNTAGTDGGGGYVNGKLTIKEGALLYSNTANNNGGGVYVTGGDFTMLNCTVGGSTEHANTATTQYGGGIFVGGTSTVLVTGGEVSYNKATANNGRGGGLYLNASSTDPITFNGSVHINYNESYDGGGAYVAQGSLLLDGIGVQVNNNTAARRGGGIYATSGGTTGSVTLNGTQMNNNSAGSGDGGGLYVGKGNIFLNGIEIQSNQANNGKGGGIYANENGCVIEIRKYTSGSTTVQPQILSNTSVSGGGLYANGGSIDIYNDGSIATNSATDNGGGIYSAGGKITVHSSTGTGSVIASNTATNWGGGIYASGDIELQGGKVKQNQAGNLGGGVHVATGGTFTMTGGVLGGTTSEGNYTTATGSFGGGLYMGGGTATIQGGSISGNYTPTGNSSSPSAGGGVYMFGGTCTLSNHATIGGTTDDYANNSDLGGGIYSAGGTITVKGGKMQRNTAVVAGGAIYTNGTEGVVNVEKDDAKATMSYIEYNSAPEGGGIYANRGTVNFSDGYIQYNHATEAGGGIYVNDNGEADYGKLFLKGSAQLVRNYVPTGKKGGGVYLKGVITVGEQVTNLGTITAKDNFAYSTETPESYVITDETRNNVYLPAPEVDNTYHKDVITVIHEGISTASEVGFSVPSNYVPVIYCANNGVPCTETGYEDYTTSQYFLHQFSTGMAYQNNLFDDSHRYVAVHYVNQPLIFDPNHVYLYGFWTNIVVTDPTNGHYEENLENINTPEKLAYFISYVNGINDCAGHPHADAVGKITADIDMSQYGWVPIGDPTNGFTGTLNGNGHTITGISSLLNGDHMAYGIVGKLKGGTVQDLFVKDAVFALEHKEGLVVGGLVGEASNGAIMQNSEVMCTILTMHSSTIAGGLVGRMGNDNTTPTLHSCIGIADMTGTHMGGLVGQLVKGNLYNSFANAKFTYHGNDNEYWGGLVAENAGTVENCYLRLRNETMPTEEHFGLLVGQNKAGGSLKYCYSLEKGASRYYADKASGSTLTDYRYYDDNTEVPYLYARRDNQVHVVEGGTTYIPAEYDATVNPALTTESDKQMMLCLNNWVTAMNANGGSYTYWNRPTTKVINDDLPVLRMPHAEALAATTDDPYLAYGVANTMLGEYTAASQAVWLYKSIDGLNDNSASYAPLYIAEGLAVVPNDGATVNAYVCQNLRNTAGVNGSNPTFGDGTPDYTDWHMFSSPLVAAPLGIDYNGDEAQYPFSYDQHLDGKPYYRFYQNQPDRGFFPSHRYGESYPTSDINLMAGNYYPEWDFYTYYEPEYHWINFKRNSNSHWHENAPDDQIIYDNEEEMTQGRGYLLASREETFLQCQGELTNGDVYIDVTNSGYYSPGYNFLGNPYLAYLDFNAFAKENSWLWGGYDKAAYAVIDELHNGYTYYAPEASVNPALATRFIAPMQGFMVLAVEADEVEFSTDMRTVTDSIGDSQFRGGDKPAYPLVNLFVRDDNNNYDLTTVELGRPEQGGAKMMRDLKQAKCHVYCHYENQDWAIAFTKPGLTEAAIRFEAYADGEYTMKWEHLNGDFSYLHLIDNMTGVDIDCLTETEYRFTASTADYRSRFRLVFDYTGVEEEIEAQDASFAFQSGDELVITGEGTLTMYDVTGRAVMKTETHGTQTAAPLPDVAAGVYLLQLDTANGTKVQKIVIK